MGRINYLLWFWRVISWDTLVPALLPIIPVAIESLFPNADDALLIAAAVIPILAGYLRVCAGGRQIDLNHCSFRVRQLQGIVLGIGIAPIVFVDSLFIVFGGRAPQARALPWLAAVFGFYFAATTIAMYPGKTPSADATGPVPAPDPAGPSVGSDV